MLAKYYLAADIADNLAALVVAQVFFPSFQIILSVLFHDLFLISYLLVFRCSWCFATGFFIADLSNFFLHMLKSLKNEQREKKFAKHERGRHKNSGINFRELPRFVNLSVNLSKPRLIKLNDDVV